MKSSFVLRGGRLQSAEVPKNTLELLRVGDRLRIGGPIVDDGIKGGECGTVCRTGPQEGAVSLLMDFKHESLGHRNELYLVPYDTDDILDTGVTLVAKVTWMRRVPKVPTKAAVIIGGSLVLGICVAVVESYFDFSPLPYGVLGSHAFIASMLTAKTWAVLS